MTSAKYETFPSTATAVIAAVVGLWAGLLTFYATGLSNYLSVGTLLIGLATMLAATSTIVDPVGGNISPALILAYLTIFLFEPPLALFIGSLSSGIGNGMARGWVPWRVAFNAAQKGLSVFLASHVFRSIAGDFSEVQFPAIVLSAVVSASVYHLSNNFFVSLLISRTRDAAFLRMWTRFNRELIVENILSLPTALLLALMYTRYGPVVLLAFLPLLPLQRKILFLYLARRESYVRIIERLVHATEMSAPYARGHARRVADLALKIADEVGLASHHLETLELAALLHDVGMLAFEEGIGSGALPGAWLEGHAELGAAIARELGRPGLSEIILNHHWPLTKGRQSGRRGNRPTLAAKIVALAEEIDSRMHGLPPFNVACTDSDIRAFLSREGTERFGERVVTAAMRVLTGR